MLTFIKFNPEDKKLLKEWMFGDVDGKKFMGTYATDDFTHLIDFIKRYLWVVSEGENKIGFFDFEIENSKIGYLAFYIRSEYRGKGMGLLMLKEAMNLSELKSVEMLEAGVEKDNHASIKILEKSGFKYAYEDEDGMFMYQLKQNDY